MIIYGYAKRYKYSGDGSLLIQVRVPSVHGPYSISDYRGNLIRSYTQDDDLPYYPSLLLPHLPNDGEVVALSSLDTSMNQLMVIGLTGGSYLQGQTNLGG